MARNKGKARKPRAAAARAEISAAAARAKAVSPQRYRLVGVEHESAVAGHRCFEIDDWRLQHARLMFPEGSIHDERPVTGKRGVKLTSFSVPVETKISVLQELRVDAVLRPLIAQLAGIQDRIARANLPALLLQRQANAGNGALYDGDIELTIGGKDAPAAGGSGSDPEFTLMQMKESIPSGPSTTADPDPPMLPAGTLVSPLEATDRGQDEMTPRTSVLDDPLSLNLSDWTLLSFDEARPSPSATQPDPQVTGIMLDVPPPKRPWDDLQPFPNGPTDLDKAFDFIKRWFTLPSNPDPVPNPNERSIGLDFNPW